MSKETNYLKNIAKETTKKPDEFLAIAGEIKSGSELLGALLLEKSMEYSKREMIEHIYMTVVPEMGIDSNYSSFYHSDSSKNERFTSFFEAVQRYNALVLEKSQDAEDGKKYVINNVPKEGIPLKSGYIRGEGYGARAEQCTIMHSQPSIENPELSTVLVYRDGKYAIVEGVEKDRFGKIDLQSVARPRFTVTDMQEILNEYKDKTKCEVIYETEEHTQGEFGEVMTTREEMEKVGKEMSNPKEEIEQEK